MTDHDASSGALAPANRRLLLLSAFLVMAILLAGFLVSDLPAFGAGENRYDVVLTSQAATAEPGTESVADVAEAANTAVVTIYTFVSQDSLPDRRQPDRAVPGDAGDDSSEVPLGAGSGWIYSADGYVVTNAHVVAGADSFLVQFLDGTRIAATLIGTDGFQDVAVLQLALAEGESVPGVATVGDSSTLRPGDPVVAIGSPLGEFTNTVSDGIVGGLDRSLDTGAGYALGNLIQHDAEVSSGNSGGPLLNMQGEVIGMNVAKIDSSTANGATVSGLNFAIDGNTVVAIVDEIIATGESVAYPYLGVQTAWTGEAQVVQAVEPGSPAADAGLEAGDVIIAIDGEVIAADTSLIDLLFQHRRGDTVTLTVDRDGESVMLDVTLGERPSEVAA